MSGPVVSRPLSDIYHMELNSEEGLNRELKQIIKFLARIRNIITELQQNIAETVNTLSNNYRRIFGKMHKNYFQNYVSKFIQQIHFKWYAITFSVE